MWALVVAIALSACGYYPRLVYDARAEDTLGPIEGAVVSVRIERRADFDQADSLCPFALHVELNVPGRSAKLGLDSSWLDSKTRSIASMGGSGQFSVLNQTPEFKHSALIPDFVYFDDLPAQVICTLRFRVYRYNTEGILEWDAVDVNYTLDLRREKRIGLGD